MGDEYTKDLADARLTLADKQADADLAWIDAKAAADEPVEEDDAGAWQSMSDGEATIEDSFAQTSDGESQSEGDTLAGQEAGVMTADAAADVTQGNSDATADANFQIAQASETANVWTWLAAQFPLPSGEGQGGGLPWAQSQAGLAGAEASWAVTAAGNYQLYVSQLGAAETVYETDNAGQFVDEMKTIDANDAAAANATADADALLTTTATDDEATLEETLASAGETYQENLGQAAHDYRQAVALAEHDLTLGIIGPGDATAQETHDNAVALAEQNQTEAENLADETFATTVQPVLTSTGTDEAEAQLTDTQTGDGEVATDTEDDNAAVTGYDDQESADYDQQQKADALAQYNWQVGDAAGHAAAIAAFAASFVVSPGNDSAGNPLPGVPSPWAGLASDQAAAQATLQTSQAAATQTRSASEADTQETQQQAQADALESKDDGDAAAANATADGAAESQEATDAARAEVPDAVFGYLPDRLVPPSDGPAPVLTPDFLSGYEANDFYVGQTSDNYDYAAGLMSINFEPFAGAPETMPDFPTVNWAYNWTGYGYHMPWGLLGTAPGTFDPSASPAPDVTLGTQTGGGGTVYGNPIPFLVRDLVRG
ncbi:MAG TPA: hypothetical protein VNH11_00590, partial [Pirellulales bacterium]|nr:hypothetical protein [Pirellulales bacterium]